MNLNPNLAPSAVVQRYVSCDADAVIDNLTRDELRAALAWAGYATWDHEDTCDLRDLLSGVVADGECTIQTVVLS